MNLPTEILLHLFKYLPHSDLLAASETCRHWYMAANDESLRENKFVNITAVERDDYSALKLFQNSKMTYKDFTFIDSDLTSKSNGFWNKKGEDIKSLTFKNCFICEKELIYLLKCCPNLEELNFSNCVDLNCESQNIQNIECCCKELVKVSDDAKDLNLCGLAYLQKLSLGGPFTLNFAMCALSFFSGQFKEFYPQGLSEPLLNSVPSKDIIVQFVASRAKIIRKLCFNFFCKGLKEVFALPDLKLESLELHFCTYDCIELLTLHQKNLRELTICYDDLEEDILREICESFVDLQYLNLARARQSLHWYNSAAESVADLHKLKKLTSLNLSFNKIESEELITGLCSDYNYTLINLVLEGVNLTERTVVSLSEKLPNLTSLVLSKCTDAVTDVSLQTILKNQVRLQHLLLSRCENITDLGLTGSAAHETTEELEEASSKRRKPDTPQSFTGYSLERLKSLKELDLSGCNRITDISLTRSFRLVELVKLNMKECGEITHLGMESLVGNCPSVEHCNLSGCNNLTDKATTIIVKGFKRLKLLELRDCKNLTGGTVEAIRAHCRKIRHLDVSGCSNIQRELARSLTAIPTLHTLSI